MLRELGLFAGIGGFSLGLEMTGGFEPVCFSEIEPYAQDVLRKHWPHVPIIPDVHDVSRRSLEQLGAWPVDVVTGGFPCQDLSAAGKGAGLSGARSRLWWEQHRIIAEIRPRYAIIENVSILRARGLEVVLGALDQIGYDAEWHCIPAAAVGALHRRDRIWIIAYPRSVEHEGQGDALGGPGAARLPETDHVADPAGVAEPEPRHQAETFSGRGHAWVESGGGGARQFGAAAHAAVADAASQRRQEARSDRSNEPPQRPSRSRQDVPNPDSFTRHERRPGHSAQGSGRRYADPSGVCADVPDADISGLEGRGRAVVRQRSGEQPAWESGTRSVSPEIWLSEPDVGRVADGIPSRVDRLKCLGNAVVPQIPFLLGQAILLKEKFG